MLKKSLFLFLFISTFLIGCTTKKSTATTTKTNAEKISLENSLLWKISGKELQKPSYLYGTIHLTCNYRLTDKLKKAFAETDQLVLELNTSDPKLQADMMKYIFLKDGKTIKSMLNAEDYKTLAAFFKENAGFDLALFNSMKPLAITSALVGKMTDCETATAYETEFVKITKSQNEEILALETVAGQLGAFDKIPYKDQLKQLVDMAKEGMGESKKQFQEMSKYYEAEDLQGLLNVMLSQGLEKDFKDVIVDERNRNWIPLIENIISKKPSFIGVGALHLPGEEGVIKLLRKKGYTVEAVY